MVALFSVPYLLKTAKQDGGLTAMLTLTEAHSYLT